MTERCLLRLARASVRLNSWALWLLVVNAMEKRGMLDD